MSQRGAQKEVTLEEKIQRSLEKYRPEWAEEKIEAAVKYIASHEREAGRPLRAYMLNLIEQDWKPTRAYFQVKGSILGKRKQYWFAYWDYLKKELRKPEFKLFAFNDSVTRKGGVYKNVMHRDFVEKPIELENYDDRPLLRIRDFMNRQLEKWLNEKRAKKVHIPWEVVESDELEESEEFDTDITSRTYEFEVFYDEESESRQYYLQYTEGKIAIDDLWWTFDYENFKIQMQKLRVWEK